MVPAAQIGRRAGFGFAQTSTQPFGDPATLKWIVDAVPDQDHVSNKGAVQEKRFFSGDRAAKTFVREMVEGHYFVAVRTAPGSRPAWQMTSEEAYRWGSEKDVSEEVVLKRFGQRSPAHALPRVASALRFGSDAHAISA
jgi:hypothetical protein